MKEGIQPNEKRVGGKPMRFLFGFSVMKSKSVDSGAEEKSHGHTINGLLK